MTAETAAVEPAEVEPGEVLTETAAWVRRTALRHRAVVGAAPAELRPLLEELRVTAYCVAEQDAEHEAQLCMDYLCMHRTPAWVRGVVEAYVALVDGAQ